MNIRLYNCNTYERLQVTSQEELDEALRHDYVPSVTEILNIINQGDYLTKWFITQSIEHYIKNGDKKAAVEFRNTESADYGTICHELCECYLNGTTYDGEFTEQHVESIEPFKRWADENVERPVFTEYFFANKKLGFGGTADMLLLLKNGEVLLADLKFKKNSRKFPLKPSLSYKTQLSAYREHFKDEFGEMKTANLLLASPFGWNKNPCLKVCDYGYEDYYYIFEATKMLWFEKQREGH